MPSGSSPRRTVPLTAAVVSDQSEYVALVKNERANIDAALSWAATNDPLLGLRIVNGLGWVWVVVGDGVTGAARIRAALSRRGVAGGAG